MSRQTPIEALIVVAIASPGLCKSFRDRIEIIRLRADDRKSSVTRTATWIVKIKKTQTDLL